MSYNSEPIIFTKHALDRLRDRSITQDLVVKVIQTPDKTQPLDKPHMTKFIRTLNQRLIHVVATYLSDQRKWLVVSVWVRGEEDPVPLVWQLVTLPFRIAWWGVKKLTIILIHGLKKS